MAFYVKDATNNDEQAKESINLVRIKCSHLKFKDFESTGKFNLVV